MTTLRSARRLMIRSIAWQRTHFARSRIRPAKAIRRRRRISSRPVSSSEPICKGDLQTVIGPVEITGASWREMKRGMTSDPIMLADGLGHESEKRWQKRKGESPDLPQVKSPSAGDSETASAVYDLILGESGDEVNEPGLHILILGVRNKDGSALDQPGPQ